MDIVLIIKAIIMAVVEGITEFLPISSTGYLIISAELLDFWEKAKSDVFVVTIQLGAILAVIYEYWGKLWSALMGFITGKGMGRQMGIGLLLATIPIVIVGFTIADYVKTYLFNVYTVSIALIIGGFIIFWVENRVKAGKIQLVAKEVEHISIKQAAIVGLIQCLSLIPGTSRSGATIIGALYLGASRKAAAEFSFFLGIPVLVGAGLLDTYRSRDVLVGNDWVIMGIGTFGSFVFALLAIRWLVAWVSSRDFKIFGWLRIITGVVILLTGVTGWINWQ